MRYKKKKKKTNVSDNAALDQALVAWQFCLGKKHVISNKKTLTDLQQTTFATQNRILAVIKPANTSEIQKCVKIANQHQIPLYPISSGKNWGYGSQVPAQDGGVIINLERLNHIQDYDEQLGYITVEAGVTQKQVADFLKHENSNFFLSVTGAAEDSSVIGNILERGDGSGPHAERCERSCNFEVILANGECIHTGYGFFGKNKAAKINRWGLGPQIDGLFIQSNLGIVSKMTIWLAPIPNFLQLVFFSLSTSKQLQSAIEVLRELKSLGILKSSISIWNDYKILANTQTYPWQDKNFIADDWIKQWSNKMGIGKWNAGTALYSASKKLGLVERAIIKKTLKNKVNNLLFLEYTREEIKQFLQEEPPSLTQFSIQKLIALKRQSQCIGIPNQKNLTCMYWRKKTPPTTNMDPNQDRCGLIWACVTVPFTQQDIMQAINVIEETFLAYEFEPNIALLAINERYIIIPTLIIYDRELANEDERALQCHDELIKNLMSYHYFPSRLGIKSMRVITAAENTYINFMQGIKTLIDPQGILAPGRYDFF